MDDKPRHYGPTDPSYWGPNGEMPTHLQALAAACERAADTHDGISEVMAGRQPEASYHKYGDADVLRSLARAIREGRVTVNEETTDGTV